jgi:ATP-dependent Clp protease ATP-binding subunit ClpB
VGYEEGGQLTEAVRRRPYSVVLLDEIEKAHPDVFNTLLQVMDDGRLTDGQGRTVDFKNTVLIMTSNIPVGPAGGDGDADGHGDAELREALLTHFKPEFVNRLDDVVRFEPLSREQISEIVEMQLQRVRARVAERGVELELSDDAKRLLGNLGYDPAYGARPLRRVIQKQLVDKLALALLEGRFHEGDEVLAEAHDGELRLERAGAKALA